MSSFTDNPEDFHLPILGPLNGTLETDLEAYNRCWEVLRYLAAGFYKANWKNRFSTHGLDLSIDKLPADFSASAEEREALREAEQKAHHDAEAEMQPPRLATCSHPNRSGLDIGQKASTKSTIGSEKRLEYFSNGFILLLSKSHHFIPVSIRISSEIQLTWVDTSPFVLVYRSNVKLCMESALVYYYAVA